jgi:hypothetical protein
MPIPNHIRKIRMGTALARTNPCPAPGPNPSGCIPLPPPKNIGGPSKANEITNEIGGRSLVVYSTSAAIFFTSSL